MSKIITQTFSLKIGSNKFHITARNYSSHRACFNGDLEVELTTEQMRELAEHLNLTADKIDTDNDFNPNKKPQP